MNVRELSTEETQGLLAREESHFFDFKSREIAAKKVEKAAVAFANADGGEVAVGIGETVSADGSKSTAILGFNDLEAMNGVLQSLFSLNPTLDISYDVLKSEEFAGYILLVRVEKGAEVYKTSDQTVYVRQGAQSLPVKDPERIAALGFAKGAQSYEDTLLPDMPPEQIVESDELITFLQSVHPKSDPLEFALNQNLIDNREWHPRVASALLFAVAPSGFIPKKCSAKITRYETAEDDPERDHLAEQHTIEGPIYRAIYDTVGKVQEVMSAVEVWTAEGLKNLEYPPEAVWETVVNAYIHRDYSISDDIQVLVYDNRIEILSPGTLPGYVTVDNILEARYSRNPKLVRTLARYPEPPNKDLGEGLNTTFQKMKEWGFKAPTITVEGNYVKVSLPHARLAAPTAAIMEFLGFHDQVTNRQARELTGIRSENLVKVEFYKLRDEGLIERVAGLAGPKSAWQLTKKGKDRLKA